jgi:hypothetical protein
MPEKSDHVLKGDPARKKIDGKRVPETMRVTIKSRDFEKTLECPLPVGDGALDISVSAPDRNFSFSLKSLRIVSVTAPGTGTLMNAPVFCSSKKHRFFFESVPLKRNDIAYASPRISKQKNKRA